MNPCAGRPWNGIAGLGIRGPWWQQTLWKLPPRYTDPSGQRIRRPAPLGGKMATPAPTIMANALRVGNHLLKQLW